MEQFLHRVNSSGITTIDYWGDPKMINNENDHWLEVKVQSRQEVVNELKKFQFDSRMLSQVEAPEASNKINIYSKTFVINLVVSKSLDVYSNDFLTILLKPGLLVTILDDQNNLFENTSEEINNNPYDLKIDLFYTIYHMISQILHQSTTNVKIARYMVGKLSLQLDEEPDDLELEDIILAKRKIYHLVNLIEDQHITLLLIPKINWSAEIRTVESEINKVVNRFRFIHNSMNRLEEKNRELQLHYQLILQEKGNKRINTLTLIQAIFVPLTLIAGIYGMNFIVMPELQWINGYYMVLGLMAMMVIVELWLFKRKGWFD
jgi:magnesium transporter